MFNIQPIVDAVSHAYKLEIKYLEDKIKAMESKMSNSNYPIIKRSTSHIVLFCGRGLGFVMENLEDKNPSNNYEIGEFRDDWIESQFEIYSDYLKGKFISVDDLQDRAITFSLLQNHGAKRLEVPDCDFDKNFKYILVYSDFNFVTLPENVFHSDVTYIPPYPQQKAKPKEKPYMDEVNAEVEEQLIQALKCDDDFLPEFTGSDTGNDFVSLDKVASDWAAMFNGKMKSNHEECPTIKGCKADVLIVDDIADKQEEWLKIGCSVAKPSCSYEYELLKLRHNGHFVVAAIYNKETHELQWYPAEELVKPKTPAQKLSEELSKKGVQDVVILANQIINGEFDCLKYIPEEER